MHGKYLSCLVFIYLCIDVSVSQSISLSIYLGWQRIKLLMLHFRRNQSICPLRLLSVIKHQNLLLPFLLKVFHNHRFSPLVK
jgi:hypothetical protein